MNRNWTSSFSLGAVGLLVTLSIAILSSSKAIAAADCTRNPDAPICDGGPKPKPPKPPTQTQPTQPVVLIEGMITSSGCDKIYFRLERDKTIPANQTEYVLNSGNNSGWRSISIETKNQQKVELEIEGYGQSRSIRLFTDEIKGGAHINKVGLVGFHVPVAIVPGYAPSLLAGSRVLLIWQYEATVPNICTNTNEFTYFSERW
jgi:hypothetical protein